MKENVRSLLRNTFTKLDLVTREEFEIQTNVLARTRQKLEALEKRVVILENQKLETKREKHDVTGDHS